MLDDEMLVGQPLPHPTALASPPRITLGDEVKSSENGYTEQLLMGRSFIQNLLQNFRS
jgi:hypothetical protein